MFKMGDKIVFSHKKFRENKVRDNYNIAEHIIDRVIRENKVLTVLSSCYELDGHILEKYGVTGILTFDDDWWWPAIWFRLASQVEQPEFEF